ncbi:Uncharacterised protein [uncultured archaeon]|nr:Uncharacterised protein [uncultured archaeon]
MQKITSILILILSLAFFTQAVTQVYNSVNPKANVVSIENSENTPISLLLYSRSSSISDLSVFIYRNNKFSIANKKDYNIQEITTGQSRDHVYYFITKNKETKLKISSKITYELDAVELPALQKSGNTVNRLKSLFTPELNTNQNLEILFPELRYLSDEFAYQKKHNQIDLQQDYYNDFIYNETEYPDNYTKIFYDQLFTTLNKADYRLDPENQIPLMVQKDIMTQNDLNTLSQLIENSITNTEQNTVEVYVDKENPEINYISSIPVDIKILGDQSTVKITFDNKNTNIKPTYNLEHTPLGSTLTIKIDATNAINQFSSSELTVNIQITKTVRKKVLSKTISIPIKIINYDNLVVGEEQLDYLYEQYSSFTENEIEGTVDLTNIEQTSSLQQTQPTVNGMKVPSIQCKTQANEVLSTVTQCIGQVPYKYGLQGGVCKLKNGDALETVRHDCSGFVYGMLNYFQDKLNLDVPKICGGVTSLLDYKTKNWVKIKVTSKTIMQKILPGDLVLYIASTKSKNGKTKPRGALTTNHIVIYAGSSYCPKCGYGEFTRIDENSYSKRYGLNYAKNEQGNPCGKPKTVKGKSVSGGICFRKLDVNSQRSMTIVRYLPDCLKG